MKDEKLVYLYQVARHGKSKVEHARNGGERREARQGISESRVEGIHEIHSEEECTSMVREAPRVIRKVIPAQVRAPCNPLGDEHRLSERLWRRSASCCADAATAIYVTVTR